MASPWLTGLVTHGGIALVYLLAISTALFDPAYPSSFERSGAPHLNATVAPVLALQDCRSSRHDLSPSRGSALGPQLWTGSSLLVPLAPMPPPPSLESQLWAHFDVHTGTLSLDCSYGRHFALASPHAAPGLLPHVGSTTLVPPHLRPPPPSSGGQWWASCGALNGYLSLPRAVAPQLRHGAQHLLWVGPWIPCGQHTSDLFVPSHLCAPPMDWSAAGLSAWDAGEVIGAAAEIVRARHAKRKAG